MFESIMANIESYEGDRVVVSIHSSIIEYIDNVDVDNITIDNDQITINIDDMFLYINNSNDLEIEEINNINKEFNLFYKSKDVLVSIEFPLL